MTSEINIRPESVSERKLPGLLRNAMASINTSCVPLVVRNTDQICYLAIPGPLRNTALPIKSAVRVG